MQLTLPYAIYSAEKCEWNLPLVYREYILHYLRNGLFFCCFILRKFFESQKPAHANEQLNIWASHLSLGITHWNLSIFLNHQRHYISSQRYAVLLRYLCTVVHHINISHLSFFLSFFFIVFNNLLSHWYLVKGFCYGEGCYVIYNRLHLIILHMIHWLTIRRLHRVLLGG